LGKNHLISVGLIIGSVSTAFSLEASPCKTNSSKICLSDKRHRFYI